MARMTRIKRSDSCDSCSINNGSIHRVLRKTYKQICQRPLVCAVSLLPHCLVPFFASESEARAKAERPLRKVRAEEACLLCRAKATSSKDKALWEDENESRSPLRYRNNSQDCCFITRPFPNAKIARINDMANFFEQKMSLFPLLKKRGSLWWQKRLSWVKKGM